MGIGIGNVHDDDACIINIFIVKHKKTRPWPLLDVQKNDRQVKSSHLLFPVTGSITPSGNGKWRQEGMWGEDVKKMVWWRILVDNYYVLLSMHIFLFLEKKCVTTTTIPWSSRLLKRRNDNHANFMCVVIQLLLPSSSNRNASG